ncbi:hypothetical protein DK68_3151 [Brucella suis]|nr:hypothetical protein DK68_3151 [Brucella suis]
MGCNRKARSTKGARRFVVGATSAVLGWTMQRTSKAVPPAATIHGRSAKWLIFLPRAMITAGGFLRFISACFSAMLAFASPGWSSPITHHQGSPN